MFTRLPDRPWGRMWMVCQRSRLWIKIIRVDAGKRTSNQYHLHRAEWHWRLGWPHLRTSMWCKVIPRKKLHRMTPGLYVEIAWGRPDEDDIVRMGDDYGRQSWRAR